jgi:Plasmid replication region DNA-binding N-term
MNATAVQHAITALKAQGGRVSVRAIHAGIGGSFRDIHHLLRDVAAEGNVVEADEESAGGPDEVPLVAYVDDLQWLAAHDGAAPREAFRRHDSRS